MLIQVDCTWDSSDQNYLTELVILKIILELFLKIYQKNEYQSIVICIHEITESMSELNNNKKMDILNESF